MQTGAVARVLKRNGVQPAAAARIGMSGVDPDDDQICIFGGVGDGLGHRPFETVQLHFERREGVRAGTSPRPRDAADRERDPW